MKRKTAIVSAIGIIIALLLYFGITALLSNTGALTVNPLPDKTQTGPTASPDMNSSFSPSPRPTFSVAPTTSPIPSQKPTSMPTSSPTQTPTSSPIPTPSPLPTPNPASIVFSDDFQSGNTSAWTNTDSSGVTLGVKNSMLECSTSGASNSNWGYVFKWLNQTYTTLDWRWYVYFGNLPTTDGNIIGAGGMYNSAIEGNFTPANGVCSVSVIRQNGANYWRLDYVNSGSIYSLNSTSTVEPNMWYLVELKAVQGAENGEVHFYLNDVEILNALGLTNNNNSGIDHVSVGGGIAADQAITWYCASAIASTEHVGPQQPLTTESLSLTDQTAAGLVSPSSYIANATTSLFFSLGTILSPILIYILGHKINK